MRLPYLQAGKAKAQMQDKFLGLCMRETCDPGQFLYTIGLSSDEYPYMAPRKPRRMIRFCENGTALLGGDKLAWVSNSKLYYDAEEICTVTSEHPQLVRMGAYLIVWPDRIIYNTHTHELISMDVNYVAEGLSVRPCMLSGQEYEYTASDQAPAYPAQYDYWYNTVSGGLYQYLGDEWQGLDTVYTRLDAAGIGEHIAEYDVVSIEGMSYPELNMEAATVYARGDNYIVVATGTIRAYEETANVTVKREAPQMDYICECGNRLWGCSSEKHEIYGSKLGDPTNWNSYLGISTDSYAATVGSEGDFTGIIAYMGYVHFWKEDRCHRLYGTRPENFQLYELAIRGVKTGCSKSLCIVNGILYYVSREGVMAFDGSSPVCVSGVLGDMQLYEAVAGAHGDKMYLSAWAKVNIPTYGEAKYFFEEGGNMLLVMDSSKGLWHLEDTDGAVVGFASTSEGDFMLRNSLLYTIDGRESEYQASDSYLEDEREIEWICETGDSGEDSPYQKWIKKLTFRVKAERGSRLMIDIMYDNDGNWQRALSYEAQGKRSVTLPIRTRRCDHYRLRYTGNGRILILSVGKNYEEGSERRV